MQGLNVEEEGYLAEDRFPPGLMGEFCECIADGMYEPFIKFAIPVGLTTVGGTLPADTRPVAVTVCIVDHPDCEIGVREDASDQGSQALPTVCAQRNLFYESRCRYGDFVKTGISSALDGNAIVHLGEG